MMGAAIWFCFASITLSPAELNSAGLVGVTAVERSGASQSNVPVTFGHVFAKGDVADGQSLSATLASGGVVQLQVDAKARHSDGSLRHAVLTAFIPGLQANSRQAVELTPAGTPANNPAVTPNDVINSAYDVDVTISIGGTNYTASASEALQAAVSGSSIKTWLSGPLVSEWLVRSPLGDQSGSQHPHLTARFNIRAYAGLTRIRTSVTIENVWAYEPNPRGFTYNVTIAVSGSNVYSQTNLKHTHHARWRKVFWWGSEPEVDVELDGIYLMATGVVPNYDRRFAVSQSVLNGMSTEFTPMGNQDISDYMPATGAHDDIGPLPRWAAIYLLTMDWRAKQNTLVNGDAGGSYQIHYRDKNTDLPVSLDDYPYMTLLGNESDTYNPATGEYEAFPDVSNGLDSYTPDDAHQPSIAFLPYLISGDYFFLEELQFWANYNLLMANPGYRDYALGNLWHGQVRGQAWSLRTLAQAAYITPEDHPLKQYFVNKLNNNIEWYTQEYLDNSSANKLGWLANGYALEYGNYGLAPWQDDFFTWSLGYLVDLGFESAREFLGWKTKFVVGRLTADGYCWLNASVYSLQVGTSQGGPYGTFAQVHSANFGNFSCNGTTMDGYPSEPTGYGANMQPALAAAVDAGVPDALAAWTKYETRNPKQDYTSSPQFALYPRLLTENPTTPVELVSFSGRVSEGRIILRWVTVSETENFGFDVERRQAPAGNFVKIGFVRGQGSSTEYNAYAFVDTSSHQGTENIYRLKQINLDGTFDYSPEIKVEMPYPGKFDLKGNYPNPFNPKTWISFVIPQTTRINLTIYDINGRKVAALYDNVLTEAGDYTVPFDASDLATGAYFYEISSETGWSETRRMMLIK
jgi:hypothetical protein